MIIHNYIYSLIIGGLLYRPSIEIACLNLLTMISILAAND